MCLWLYLYTYHRYSTHAHTHTLKGLITLFYTSVSACLSVRLSVCLSVSMSPPVYIHTIDTQNIHQNASSPCCVCFLVFECVFVSVCIALFVSTHNITTHTYIKAPLHSYVCLLLFECVCLFLCLFLLMTSILIHQNASSLFCLSFAVWMDIFLSLFLYLCLCLRITLLLTYMHTRTPPHSLITSLLTHTRTPKRLRTLSSTRGTPPSIISRRGE